MKQKKFKEKKTRKNFFQLVEERILHFKKLGKKKNSKQLYLRSQAF